MKIAFWNTGGMGADSEKLRLANSWYKNCNPDIWVLEEVSHTLDLTQLFAGGSGNCKSSYTTVDDKNGTASTKGLALVYKDTLALNPTSKALPNQRAVANDRSSSGLLAQSPQRRECIYFSCKVDGTDHDFYGLHANASTSGGDAAVACLASAIEGSRVNTVAGGDFNSTKSVEGAHIKKVLGKAYDGTDLKFTQWDKSGKPAKYTSAHFDFKQSDYASYLTSVHLPADHRGQKDWTQHVEPHKVIDYVLCASGVTITAEKNCKDVDEWFEILKTFDHCPVVYTIT